MVQTNEWQWNIFLIGRATVHTCSKHFIVLLFQHIFGRNEPHTRHQPLSHIRNNRLAVYSSNIFVSKLKIYNKIQFCLMWLVEIRCICFGFFSCFLCIFALYVNLFTQKLHTRIFTLITTPFACCLYCHFKIGCLHQIVCNCRYTRTSVVCCKWG